MDEPLLDCVLMGLVPEAPSAERNRCSVFAGAYVHADLHQD